MSNTIRGTSKEYPQRMFSLRNKKQYQYVYVEKKHHILPFVTVWPQQLVCLLYSN